MRILATAATAIALTLSASTAMAQYATWRSAPAQSRYDEGYQRVYPNGQVCERICPGDYSPCDPINFKIADARCNPNMLGR